MKKMLATAAVAAGLATFSGLAHGQDYTVNGHASTKAEAQLPASNGAQPGGWYVDGRGVSAATDERNKASSATINNKCWFVLDVQLCE